MMMIRSSVQCISCQTKYMLRRQQQQVYVRNKRASFHHSLFAAAPHIIRSNSTHRKIQIDTNVNVGIDSSLSSRTTTTTNSANSKIEKLAREMLHQKRKLSTKDLPHIQRVMQHYANTARATNATEVKTLDDFVDKVEKLYHRISCEISHVQPSRVVYHSLLDVLACAGQTHRTCQILEHMEGSRCKVKPDVDTFNLCIFAWVRSGGKGAGVEAEALISKMQQLRNKHIRPNMRSWNWVISAWGRSDGGEEAGFSAERILCEMEEVSGTTCTMQPDRFTFQAVADAWAGSGYNRAVEKVEQLVHRQECLFYDGGDAELKPQIEIYHSLLLALVRSERKDALMSAVTMLERMMCGDIHVVPNTRTFAIVLNAIARSNQEDAAEMADQILQRMLSSDISSNVNIRPNDFTFNIVIDAYAKSNKKDAAYRAEELLDCMTHFYDAGERDMRPNIVSYVSTIDAWAKAGNVERAQAILDRMEDRYSSGDHDLRPSSIAYSTVLNAWAKSGEKGSGEMALQSLKRLYDVCTLENDYVTLSTNMFNTVIDAMKNDPQSNVHQIEGVVQWMKEIYERGEHKYVLPDVITYTSLIAAWANSGEPNSVGRAEKILHMMEDHRTIKPTTVSYAVVLNALAKSRNNPDAALQAERLLDKMEYLKSVGYKEINPNVVCFTSVINAWSNSKKRHADKKIDEILQKMWSFYKSGNKETKPNAITYASVINALSRSRRSDKARRAKEYLGEMVCMYRSGDKDLKPNTFVFNAVIGACATTRGNDKVRNEAFEIAMDIFKQMKERNFTKPDSYTYATLLKACGSLLPRKETGDDVRDNHGITLFRACCEDGLLTANVLSFLMSCVSKETFAGIHERVELRASTSAENILERLPREWKRNVPKQINKNKRRTFSEMRTSGRRLRKEGGTFS